jgi:ribosomal protein S18 acetylase RimI-like enzyme
MLRIREYQPEDKDQVHTCFLALQEFLHQLEPTILTGTAAGKYFAFMFARCAATAGKVFVAEGDYGVVGFVCVWGKVPSEDLDEEPGEYAFISDLIVLPAYRHQGIGQRLLHTAEAYARAQGAATLELEVLPTNEQALQWYIRHGFRPYHWLLKKSLD